jgi:hypothetical protein|tara:strand:- start:1135 stop:1248 length:114 start_codon:yes stop_codon:yes gene_type:complete
MFVTIDEILYILMNKVYIISLGNGTGKSIVISQNEDD